MNLLSLLRNLITIVQPAANKPTKLIQNFIEISIQSTPPPGTPVRPPIDSLNLEHILWSVIFNLGHELGTSNPIWNSCCSFYGHLVGEGFLKY